MRAVEFAADRQFICMMQFAGSVGIGIAQIRVGYDSRFVSNGDDYARHNPSDHPRLVATRGASYVAAQPKLGLLSRWWPRLDSRDCPYPGAIGPHLTTTLVHIRNSEYHS